MSITGNPITDYPMVAPGGISGKNGRWANFNGETQAGTTGICTDRQRSWAQPQLRVQEGLQTAQSRERDLPRGGQRKAGRTARLPQIWAGEPINHHAR